MTTMAYGSLLLAAVARPAAEMLPALYPLMLDLSGAAWIGAFTLFTIEHAPMLLGPSLAGRAR
jgi:uncharacterized protein involved in response to NO